MGGLQLWHWVVVAIVGLILFFGWKQLPDMARSVGRSLRVFKTEIKGLNEDDDKREQAREERDGSRESSTAQVEQAPQPKQIAERPVPQAQVVRNPAAAPAPAETARSRPRPTPSPNGRAAR